MVNIYKAKAKPSLQGKILTLTIDSADYEVQGIAQYQQNRDHREPLFEFKRRALVHFAVDTEEVFMTTRLAGSATHFLPFNQGHDGGA